MLPIVRRWALFGAYALGSFGVAPPALADDAASEATLASNAPPAQGSEATSWMKRERAIAPYGMLSVSAGIASRVYWVSAGDGPRVRQPEGESTDALWYQIQYAIPIVPFFGVRAFVQRTSFSTELSDASGLDSYRYYELALAPATSVVLKPKHGPPTILSLSVPVGLAWSVVTNDPERDVIAEHWSTGFGWRIGVAGSAMFVPTRHFAVTTDVAINRVEVNQPITYRALDGSGATAEESRQYLSWRSELSIGVVWVL